MTYRLAHPSEYEPLAAVLKAAYAVEPWNERWSDERALRRIQGILHNFGSICIVADDKGSLLGSILGFIDPYADQDFFFISELFVLPQYQHRGIGTQLLRTLETVLKEKGISTTQIISIENNLPFYSKAGYQQDVVSVLYNTLSQQDKD